MALQVSGKTALVTGGGSGICLAFTKLLLQNNCNVVIADVQLIPEAEELVKKTAGEKVRVVYQKTDVMDWAQLEAAFARAMEEFGSLDVVCPGAGIFEPVCDSQPSRRRREELTTAVVVLILVPAILPHGVKLVQDA